MSKPNLIAETNTKVVFLGSGAIATALGNVLAKNNTIDVVLLSIEEDVVESITIDHTNTKYFPNFILESRLKATQDTAVIAEADIIFLALPSTAVIGYLESYRELIPADALLVNLAKGFGRSNSLIPETLNKLLPNTIAVMKGPSFAREIINRQPTAFTVSASESSCFDVFKQLFNNSNIYLDFTDDLIGVEYASILKNIYAILIGIVDANFDSPNLRSLVLSKSINEMRRLISFFGGREETIFNYCGFGDFSLTALNDLSRNRTLGLLIGKGFFTQGISDKVVLEGRIAVNVFYELLTACCEPDKNYPLMAELYKVFKQGYDIKHFVNHILKE